MSTPFITPSDLRAALSPDTYLQIFDDDNVGSVDDAAANVLQVIRRAHAEVISYLPSIWETLPDETRPAPELLWSCELDFAVSLSYMRHPEYVRTFGNDPKGMPLWAKAEARMKRIATSEQRVVDAPEEPKPRNVGGLVTPARPPYFIRDPDHPDRKSTTGIF